MIHRLGEFASLKYFRLILGALIAGVSLYLALRNVSYQEVSGALAGTDLAAVWIALASVAVNNLGKAIRWKVLFGAQGQGVGLKRSIMVILASQALNSVYPARVGDLSRAYAVSDIGPGWVYTFGTIVLEKLFDMLAYILLFCVLFLLIPLPDWVSQSVLLFVIVTLFGLGIILLVIYRSEQIYQWLQRLIRWFPEQFEYRLQSWLQSALASLRVLRNRKDLTKIVFWSALIWGTAVLTNHLVLVALHISLPVTASILVLVVLQVGLSLPSAPGRIGVFEYLSILALSVFGINRASALSYGILLHMITWLPQTLLGLLFVGTLGMVSGSRLPDRAEITAAADDPIGRSKEEHRATAGEIEGLLDKGFEELRRLALRRHSR